jgi:lipopolysaccharide transport system ATP-binding protein
MSSNYAIEVSDLGKCYQIYDKPSDRLKQTLFRGSRKYFKEFWALKDVSFKVKKGETIGIIGRNGSGKSTLLQIICGTLNPTFGQVKVNGKVSALLELGAGFNPEFTGFENIYMAASLYGLTREEVDQRFDAIASFADIGDYIYQPVKTYSSGMYVRLAFAVIANVDADILIIDEALAVGDAFFTQKCMRFIRDFKSRNGTIIFVSHDLASVINICDRALLIYPKNQFPAELDSADKICQKYLSQFYDNQDRFDYLDKIKDSSQFNREIIDDLSQKSGLIFDSKKPRQNKYSISEFNVNAESFGLGGAKIISAEFFDKSGRPTSHVNGGEVINFVVSVRFNKDVVFPAVGLILKDRLGQYIYTEGTDAYFREHSLACKKNYNMAVKFSFLMPILHRGIYTMDIAVAEGVGDDHVQHHWIHDALKIESLTSPVVHGVSGLIDSKIKVTITR